MGGGPGGPMPPPSPCFHPQCQHIVGICESIVGCSPPALLDRRAVLERVGLVPAPEPWGSPPASPSTPTLPPKLWSSPPASPSTPTLPCNPLVSPPVPPTFPFPCPPLTPPPF